MKPATLPICESCIHYRPDTAPLSCDAFPAGPIPRAIIFSTADHRLAYPGDHGVRFEQDPAKRRPAPIGATA